MRADIRPGGVRWASIMPVAIHRRCMVGVYCGYRQVLTTVFLVMADATSEFFGEVFGPGGAIGAGVGAVIGYLFDRKTDSDSGPVWPLVFGAVGAFVGAALSG